jgi:hypothetical protein
MAVRKHVTLVAATPQTVTVDGGFGWIEVVNTGTGNVYFTVDGSVPTVGGDDTWVAVPGFSSVLENVDRAGTVDVKLISAGTPTVSVQVRDWPWG